MSLEMVFLATSLLFLCSGLVRRQINTAEHDPYTCADLHLEWPTDECPQPLFQGSSAAVSIPCPSFITFPTF